jgi:hypothetical protein
MVVAVADGHGDDRHFRSGRGARMAVSAGISAALGWTRAAPGGAAGVERDVRGVLVPRIVARWDDAIAADIDKDQPCASERAMLAELGLPLRTAYGSTLLLGVFTSGCVVFAQIGDGDILAVRPDGGALSPVLGDSGLGGWRTTSLCQANAAAAFRVGVVPLTACPLFAVLLATDGFSNAQADVPWQPGFAADLARYGLDHDHGWFAAQVPGWAEQCASAAGSGDDATIALVINSAERPVIISSPPTVPYPFAALAQVRRISARRNRS